MKKLLFCAMLLVSTTAFCQTQWSTYRNQIGTWDSYSKKWVYGEVNYSDIIITFGKAYVSMDNRAQSYYRITVDNGESTGYTNDYTSYKSHSWDALDDKNRKCILSMIKYEGDDYDIVFSVMYDDIVFKYYHTPIKKTDRFNQ